MESTSNTNETLPRLVVDPTYSLSPLRSPPTLPQVKTTKRVPKSHPSSTTNASFLFIGTAPTLLEWEGLRLMTDPNFLHAGDHVHLGPRVTGRRLRSQRWNWKKCLGDHFDQKVEESLRRSLPIITTPHAKAHLASKPEEDEAFTSVCELDTFQSMMVDIQPGPSQTLQSASAAAVSRAERIAAMKVTAMPGKHVPPGVLETLNDFVKAVPPINGWMLEPGYVTDLASEDSVPTFQSGYRICISGDTLPIDDLNAIPARYSGQNIDLMLIHLGRTIISGPSMPLLMVTMDAEQGLGLMRLINLDVTIPIHYDDYDVFLSPLEDFRKSLEEAGLIERVIFLDRGEGFEFEVRSNT